MTDCSSIHGSTSSSSDLNSHHGGCGAVSRIRTIKMARPHTGNGHTNLIGHPSFASFGFSLRGGREFGTGFFVSNVIKGSEADLKGLQVGDQIIRVGGNSGSYRVDDAVHRELSQYIMNQDRLMLKVRGVGIIPVKEKASDPLTWHVVPMAFGHDDAIVRDVRIILNVAPRTKLGCGICKGPEWKPGIFVQFTKENGIARESGLRPGDQILSCNGIDFSDILFSEAVAIMKSSQVLELFVRTGVGLELFPGESSGYNSSASSVTGDQSPCWGDQAAKRLSIVREESTSSTDRINGTFRPKSRDRRKDKPMAVDVPKIPANYSLKPPSSNAKGPQNTTIIKLSENGTVINNTLIPNMKNGGNHYKSNEILNEEIYSTVDEPSIVESPLSEKIANICFVSKQNETKIVTVEVHRSSSTKIAPPPQFANHQEPPEAPPSITISNADESSSGQSSLSSAINEELRRRAEKKKNAINTQDQSQSPALPVNESSNDVPSKKNPTTGNAMGGQIHNILMDEFKKAHRKMFKNGFMENEYQQPADDEMDKTATIKADGNSEERQQEQQLRNGPPPVVPVKKIVDVTNGIKKDDTVNVSSQIMPSRKLKAAPPPPPVKKQTSLPIGVIDREREPWTPAPDYDSPDGTTKQQNCEKPKGTIGRIAMHEMAKANGDMAEMESIESFHLNNPSSPVPVPPPMYFSLQKSGPPTMKKIQRPISVIVSSYGNKKEPGKFNFIESEQINNNKNEDMSMRLKNELEKTLSRSNLRRRSDSIEDFLKSESKPIGNIMHLNGDSEQTINDKNINDGPRMNQKTVLKKYETSTLNGILKNGTTKLNGGGIANGHTKNISFGDVTK